MSTTALTAKTYWVCVHKVFKPYTSDELGTCQRPPTVDQEYAIGEPQVTCQFEELILPQDAGPSAFPLHGERSGVLLEYTGLSYQYNFGDAFDLII